MEIEQLNDYLALLHGRIEIQSIEIEKADVTGQFRIKFGGDIGTKDNGEIELKFYGVDSHKMGFSIIGPVQIEIENELVSSFINNNYIDEKLNFYTLRDDVDYLWWIYAKDFEAKLLPIFYD